MNYVKYLDLINYGKQATVIIEILVHVINITFYGYWNVITKLRPRETLSLTQKWYYQTKEKFEIGQQVF